MSDYIKNALLDVKGDRKLKEESKALVNKWDKTGLLEGLDSDYQKSSMSILLENQAKQLIDEASKTNMNGTSSEEWSGVALPLVRRIFAEIAAQDFVSVQPMNLPSGLVFYLDFKYGGSQAGRSTSESLAGSTGANSPLGNSDDYPSKGLYGTGRYAFTQPTASTVISANANSGSSAVTLADLNYDSEFSASNAGKIWKITKEIHADLTRPDVLSLRSWVPSHSAGDGISGSLPQFTSTGSDGVTFFFKAEGEAGGVTFSGATSSGNVNVDTIEYYVQPDEANRGDFEDGNAASQDSSYPNDLPIPEINLEMQSKTIVAKTRKLKAVWTPELAQDLNAYHSVDAEAELTAMLSEYISMEIDLEILDMLMTDAQTVDYWSASVGEDWDGSAFSKSLHATNALAYTKKDWYQTLGQTIQRVSNKIHQLTLRGGANFLVCSPDVATIIESIEGFGAATDGNQSQFAMGVRQVGSLSNRWNVYKNPYMTSNEILVGFRGSNFLETGAVYAPYVPLIMTPLVYDPVNFTPRKGVMTRYAKKMVRPEFYGKIFVKGLETV